MQKTNRYIIPINYVVNLTHNCQSDFSNFCTIWDKTDVITITPHPTATLNNEGQFYNLEQVEHELR